MPADTAKQKVENDFMQRVYSLIAVNIDDSTFGVEELANSLSMSRASLHRKIKSSTGLSSGELIHNYCMQQAATLLQQGCSSSQAGYRTGFDSPAYFTKCFREYFGVTPVKFIQLKK